MHRGTNYLFQRPDAELKGEKTGLSFEGPFAYEMRAPANNIGKNSI